MIYIRSLIVVIMSVYATFLTMRHNLHMFQLNGYKNDEHINWLKKNLKRQWLLLLGFVVGLLRCFVVSWGLDIFIVLILILDILVFRAIRRLNNKKKLVYTDRVKRLITTMVIIDVVIFVCVYLYGGVERLCGISIIVVSIQWFLNILANVINHPIEKSIGNYYINDAKKIIKSRPDLTIIGITGSYGKTSVKYYLQTLLQGKYSVLVTPGNFNTTFGVTRTIREHLKPEHEIFLCEMGARRVNDIKEICDIVHPKYGIVSSVGPQHLDTFFNMENIKKTKFELIDALPDDGIAFLNGDNEYILDQAKSYNNTVFYHGEKTGSGYYAKDITLSQMGTQFTVVAPNGEEEQFQMRLVGGHNIVNVVGAISVAHTLGISLKDLKVPVRRLEPVEHRMQIRHQGLATIIDDAYNSNPVGSKAAVETLAMFDGARILITPGMVELGEKEKEFNFAFGTYAAECCDYILLVHEEHSRPIKEGALSKGFPEDKLFVFSKVQDAISFAYSIKEDREKYILLENDLPDNY